MFYINEKLSTVSEIVNAYEAKYGEKMSSEQLVEQIVFQLAVKEMVPFVEIKELQDLAKANILSFNCVNLDGSISPIIYRDGFKYDATVNGETEIFRVLTEMHLVKEMVNDPSIPWEIERLQYGKEGGE